MAPRRSVRLRVALALLVGATALFGCATSRAGTLGRPKEGMAGLVIPIGVPLPGPAARAMKLEAERDAAQSPAVTAPTPAITDEELVGIGEGDDSRLRIARAPVAPGRNLVLALRTPVGDAAPAIALALVEGDRVVLRANDAAAVFGPGLEVRGCSAWRVAVVATTLGKVEAFRVGVHCSAGTRTSELGALLHVPPVGAPAFERLWSGPGDERGAVVGRCETIRTVTFAAPREAIERTTVVETRWHERAPVLPPSAAGAAESARKDCAAGSSKTVEALAPGGA